ncbi:enoyl-CoA hydratase-related protein [Cuniculiplasma sp. SKW3]|uniref:enoyl-CoA hydratase-related protein n=1 Tax=Cuniculiplasma sp. SKW3 TaxID=3400170 RepID=UPI003FD39E22
MSVLTEEDGPVLIVKLNRPEKRNAIDLDIAESLEEIFSSFEEDDKLRVAVIYGTGGNFCAGADLTDLERLSKRAMNINGPLGFTRKILKKPVIAAISGYAVAGGFELALWADFRICDSTSRFGFLERRFGVPLIDGGTQRLPIIAGLGNALYLITTGTLIDSKEAMRMNIVSEICSNPLERAIELGKIISGFPKETLIGDRMAVFDGIRITEGIYREAVLGSRIINRGIHIQGAKKFMDGEGRSGKPL